MAQHLATTTSLMLMGAWLALACGSNDAGELALPNPVDTTSPSSAAGASAQPPATASEPSEASPSGPGSESQPTNVVLSPPSTPDSLPAAGEPAESGLPVPSAGCGSTAAVASGRFTLDVANVARDYILELPEDYDASRPYRLVFGWHPRGGSAEQVANGFGGGFYGLERLAQGTAIFVSPEGVDEGWANTGGRDIAFLDAMLDRLRGELCIDESRIFSTGFSYGGMMSLAVGCARADVFRAIAPMSGALYSGCEDGSAPIAMLGFHGVDDTVVPLANGIMGRNVFVERNGCDPEASAVEVDGCLSFRGCAEGAPVTWCEFDGGHTPAPGSAEPIWAFFSQF
ncbi:MAG TPA: prolyl oligopeptidase family serine peptidase [Polyangiaceae bacterium]|nr:prolyl oligopeptidase family serine peptidase [Polyangiaceae bacterium]